MTYPDPTPPDDDPVDGWWIDNYGRRKSRHFAIKERRTRAADTPVHSLPRQPIAYKPKRKIGFRQ